MRDDEVDGVGLAVPDSRLGDFVEVVSGEGMGDIERIVDIDVAVGVFVKVVEDMRLEGVRWLHDEGVEI